jgi:hypothetical protein
MRKFYQQAKVKTCFFCSSYKISLHFNSSNLKSVCFQSDITFLFLFPKSRFPKNVPPCTFALTRGSIWGQISNNTLCWHVRPNTKLSIFRVNWVGRLLRVRCESFVGARPAQRVVCAVATSFSPLSTALALCAAERVRIFYLLKAGQSVCVFALAHIASIVGGAIGSRQISKSNWSKA